MSERKRQGHERVHGPYKHGRRWRVVVVGATGASEYHSFESEREAADFIAEAQAIIDSRTVAMAIDAYLAECPERGRKTAWYRLRAVLGTADRPVTSLTAHVARKLYSDRASGWERRGTQWVQVNDSAQSGATLHGELAVVNRWAEWCVARGWMRINPFAGIEPAGEVRRGKPKLRVNASRQFLDYVLNDDSMEATAVLTAFALGLRASAVVKRRVEDLDDDGWLLWVRDNKTAAGDLEIEVPDWLRPRLLKLTADRAPDDLIFGALTRHGLHYHTVRFCRLAGVPRVTPHGLRGSAATKAVRLGGSVEDVARAIGHADDGATLKRHYLGGGAIESARARMVSNLVSGTTRVSAESAPLTQSEERLELETRTDFAFPNPDPEVTN